METQIYDPILANQAQIAYCNANNAPHFAPIGNCYDCRKNIYQKAIINGRETNGISVERAGTGLITGCPHCCHSYCD